MDTTRIYREAYAHAGATEGLIDDSAAEREAAAELVGDTGTEEV